MTMEKRVPKTMHRLSLVYHALSPTASGQDAVLGGLAKLHNIPRRPFLQPFLPLAGTFQPGALAVEHDGSRIDRLGTHRIQSR
jgi:hypothetical protein